MGARLPRASRRLQEDAVTKWEELHPEKKRKKGRAAGFGERPDGIDAATWERLMGQMKGDFSWFAASRATARCRLHRNSSSGHRRAL